MTDTPIPPGTDGELSLREVLRRLDRRRTSFTVLPIVVLVLAGLGSLLMPAVYQPQAIISIEMPRGREGQPLVPLETLVQNYRYLLRSENFQARVMETVTAETGATFEPKEFGARVGAAVPRESQLLFVSFRDEDAPLATRVTNALAEALTDAANQFNSDEVSRFLNRYRSDIASSEAEVESVREALVAFQRESQLDLLEDEIEVASLQRSQFEERLLDVEVQLAVLDADPIPAQLELAESERVTLQTETQIEALTNRRESLLEQQGEFETELATVRVDLAGKREALAALQTGLAEQRAVTPLRRSIEDEAALQQAMAQAGGVDLAALLGITVTVEEINPIHASISTETIKLSAAVQELAHRETALSARLEVIEAEIRDVDTAIYRGEIALARSERGLDLADAQYREVHKTSRTSLEAHRSQLGVKVTELSERIRAMRDRLSDGTAELEILEKSWELAFERLGTYHTELATATFTVLEQRPTLALLSPAHVPAEPESRSRKMILLTGLMLGLALAVLRAYLLEF